jgi:hypothetical protein
MKLFLSIILSFALFVGAGFALQAHAQSVASGCSSAYGYSTTTGQACNGSTVIPAGCSSTAGFNANTGMPCNGAAASTNGYSGATVGSNGYLNGCTSTSGYSATTGYACNMPVNGYIYTGNGTTTNVGAPATVVPTSPGLPTTGAGNQALPTALVLVASGLIAFTAARYTVRTSAR